jgi:hypothetical protein
MYSKIHPVLGEDVIFMEEDGFYKIRVTRIRQDIIRDNGTVLLTPPASGTDSAGSPGSGETGSEAAPQNDTIKIPDEQGDTVGITSSSGDTASVVAETTEAVRKFFLLNSNSPWLKRINYFGKSFAFVNALIITIFLSILSMIILLVVILLNRTRLEKEEKLRSYLSETYQTMIVDYLFADINTDKFLKLHQTNTAPVTDRSDDRCKRQS